MAAMRVATIIALVFGLADALDIARAVPLADGVVMKCGGSGGPEVPQSVFECVHDAHGAAHDAQGISQVSFTISGWAFQTPGYYNISAMVASVRNARKAGLTVTLGFYFDELGLPPTVVNPSLDALDAAGLISAVERVFLYIEGNPILWGADKAAVDFMMSTIDLFQKRNLSVGIATNDVQWNWITKPNITEEERLVVGKLPVWYDSASASRDFSDWSTSTNANLRAPTGPWQSPKAKTWKLQANVTACGYQTNVFKYIYDTSPDPAPADTCKVGDVVSCPGLHGEKCAGNQCCQSGITCPSASEDFKGCLKPKTDDCVKPKLVVV